MTDTTHAAKATHDSAPIVLSRCRWCGSTLRGRPTKTQFCSRVCRDSCHNLRKSRGEEIYDLLMAWSHSYKNRWVLTDIGRIVRAWRDDDATRGRATALCQRSRA